ncbi:hypothetical protein EYF80_006697 [Liparis tanakae]|uniref:Uncharacterized protein n=1 Tax=Liparis tanakae TaxID=230148 RepID=A0A4Z2IYM6_9TELE|nr:hypothetical protein EYF80_006697 [Liparis tanakae]
MGVGGDIVVLSLPPPAALPIGGETPGLMGVAKVRGTSRKCPSAGPSALARNGPGVDGVAAAAAVAARPST